MSQNCIVVVPLVLFRYKLTALFNYPYIYLPEVLKPSTVAVAAKAGQAAGVGDAARPSAD